jgi:hypothetical protein
VTASDATHFYPQQWLLCHMGLYYFEFEFGYVARAGSKVALRFLVLGYSR